jgi:arsenite methyltransferase
VLEQRIRTEVAAYVDRLLDAAKVGPAMTLLDVGTGEGVVAFRAIERFGPDLRVILTDVSSPLLQRARAKAESLRVMNQCEFIACGADQLGAINDLSVDAITSRAALAYVPDKIAAIQEFARILKPGGRISLAEPIFQDEAFEAYALRAMLEQGGERDVVRPLMHRWKAAQFPDTPEAIAANSLTNFSERSLFALLRGNGFCPLHLELHVDLSPALISSWDTFINTAPHTLAPTLKRILAERFNARERALFEAAMRPQVESGGAPSVSRIAYLSGTKSQLTAPILN